MRAFNLQNQKGHPYITAQDATINFTGNVKKNNAALTTSNELNAAVDRLEAEIAGMASVSFRSVNTLPQTGESNVIYLVPKDSTTPTDVKNEYIWVDNKWELIGNTEIDLSTKQDKLYLYTEDTTTHLVEFPLAKVRASTFECGPISLTSADQSPYGNFVCGINEMSPTHYTCGPVHITENGFIADTIKIDEYGLRVNYNNPDSDSIILNSNDNSISCASLECNSLECFTSFVCGPLSIMGTEFTCGPVHIDSAFVCGPVEMYSNGMRIYPITIVNNTNTFIRHQQICEVNVQGSSTFNLAQLQLDSYCTAEIWLTYGSSATAAVQFPSNWHWMDTTSPSTPPTFQQGWKYFIVIRNDSSRILARVADSYDYTND